MNLKCLTFQVTLLLSSYILRNKQRFFDTRNIKLAMVKGDLLGDAFGVNAFHRCQVNNLLRGQLIPYNPDNPPDKAIVHSYATPGCSVSLNLDAPVVIKNKKVKVKTILESEIIMDLKKIETSDGNNYENELVEFLKKKIEKLEEELKCPVCLTTAEPPILTCSNQHHICEDCWNNLTKCPLCREEYIEDPTQRHRYAEKDYKELQSMQEKLWNLTIRKH